MIRDQSNGWYTNKPVAVEYRYHFHDRRRRDICNYEKLLSDCITHAKVWRDDQQVDDARLLRMPVDASCPRVEVRIREL
jgi:Holliday junction resolvase RusA-like endonuclease